jgi:hypothetical protein
MKCARCGIEVLCESCANHENHKLRTLNRELVGALKLLRAVFIVGGTYEMQNNALAAADAALARAKGIDNGVQQG